jgi:small subunit ribosomal protein S2e
MSDEAKQVVAGGADGEHNGEERRGFGGRGRGRGGRGRGRGRRGRGRRGGSDEKAWVPVTKLGRLVQAGKIKKIEEIFLAALPIKEYQIVDKFLPELKDEVLKIAPVQKQTTAGQRTRFKAAVVVGDYNGHIGLGHKCSKEVAGAIRGALIDAKLNIYPIRRGFWGNRFGAPHTVPTKVTGKCGSVRFRLIPAPRGTGLVAARAPKKLLNYAGYKDVYTNAKGNTKCLGNFVKAAFAAICATNAYLTPDRWAETVFTPSPFQQHTDFLKDAAVKEKATKHFERRPRGRGNFNRDRAERGAPTTEAAPEATEAAAPVAETAAQ